MVQNMTVWRQIVVLWKWRHNTGYTL